MPTSSSNALSKAIKYILLSTLFVTNSISTNQAISDLLQATKVTPVLIRGLCCHGFVSYMAKNYRKVGQDTEKASTTSKLQDMRPPRIPWSSPYCSRSPLLLETPQFMYTFSTVLIFGFNSNYAM